jgi:hypothetical protein
MSQSVKIFSLLIVATLLVACGAAKKEYVAPDNPDAESCISSCGTIRTQCRAMAQDRYKVCRDNYEFQDRLYANCVRSGNLACQKPPRCPPPETRGCSAQYDGCFQSCGGTIKSGKD